MRLLHLHNSLRVNNSNNNNNRQLKKSAVTPSLSTTITHCLTDHLLTLSRQCILQGEEIKEVIKWYWFARLVALKAMSERRMIYRYTGEQVRREER